MWILFVFFNSHRRLPLYLKFQPFHKFRCCSGFFRRWISVTFGESVDAISVPYNKVLHLRQETSIKLSGLLPTARVKPGSNSFFNAKTYLFCLFRVNNNFVIHPLMDFASQYSKKKIQTLLTMRKTKSQKFDNVSTFGDRLWWIHFVWKLKNWLKRKCQ